MPLDELLVEEARREEDLEYELPALPGDPDDHDSLPPLMSERLRTRTTSSSVAIGFPLAADLAALQHEEGGAQLGGVGSLRESDTPRRSGSSGGSGGISGLAAALHSLSRNASSASPAWRCSARVPSFRAAGSYFSVEANSPAYLSNR